MKPLFITSSVIAAAALAAALPGCGPRPAAGGTAGHLLAAGKPLPDVQVTIYQNGGGSLEPLGFGVSDADGSFRLFTNQARGPLTLAAGDYRCTLESAGAPVRIPNQFAKPETTPLKVSWTGAGSFDLTVTEKLIP